MASNIFSVQCITDIENSVCSTAKSDHLALLGSILRYWAENELKEHLSHETKEQKDLRNYRLSLTLKSAKDLDRVLDALYDFDCDYVNYYADANVVRELADRVVDDFTGSFVDALNNRVMDDLKDGLKKFIPAVEHAIFIPKKGQPPTVIPYLVVLDAAAIYTYITGRKATRTEAQGSFTNFCTPIWNTVFGENTRGFTAAMKKLESERNAGRGASPIITNFFLRQSQL
jgi:hypothetical protein